MPLGADALAFPPRCLEPVKPLALGEHGRGSVVIALAVEADKLVQVQAAQAWQHGCGHDHQSPNVQTGPQPPERWCSLAK